MEFLHQNIVSALILAINLAATVSYFTIYSNDNLKNRFFRLPVALQKIYAVFFVAPLFVAPFLSVSKFANFNILLISLLS